MSLLSLTLYTLLSGAAAAPAPEAETAVSKNTYFPRVIASMRASGSPRQRALAATALDPDWETRSPEAIRLEQGKRLREAAQAAPADPLVQYLWSTSRDGCDAANPCPGREMALARLQPDNGAAWVPELAAAARAKDAARIDAAVARIAAAERFEDFYVPAFREWKKAMDRVPMTALEIRAASSGMPAESLLLAMATSHAAMVPLGSNTLELSRACNRERTPTPSAARLRDCARAGRLMHGVGTSNVSQAIGRALVRNSGVETEADRSARRVADWRSMSFARSSWNMEKDAAQWLQYFSDLDATDSEARAQELLLARMGIALEPPAGWDAEKAGAELMRDLEAQAKRQEPKPNGE